ncbi:MAG: hypothetical protein AVDCRST_MAG55-1689 [uncultured Rubrobacteraceae bacterium]|uniref:Uncharacterized protein n=1 Tax=uncultured Rubrobacteraceae bacterium TaxID=349277 RepID=A0A6J4PI52_9ACTN|nr:MAG: hypothetical protein AVDCRST_MAG55-1689 [uncultured Rubrobacteraceae bacterium]
MGQPETDLRACPGTYNATAPLFGGAGGGGFPEARATKSVSTHRAGYLRPLRCRLLADVAAKSDY